MFPRRSGPICFERAAIFGNEVLLPLALSKKDAA